jgi:hypothetical protein
MRVEARLVGAGVGTAGKDRERGLGIADQGSLNESGSAL